MTTITIGNGAGNYDLNVLGLDFGALLDKPYETLELTPSRGSQTLKMTQANGDYMQLVGTFNMAGIESNNHTAAVEQISAVTVAEGGDISYKIGALHLTGADVKSGSTFAAFIDQQTYKILGNNGDNELSGGIRADQLLGNGGNDKLYGSDGNDKILGGIGNDLLSGGNQDDVLSGEAGNDKLDGGDGNDRLTGGAGKNELKGGAGNDTYYIGGTDKIVEAKGTAGGVDTIVSASNADLNKFSNIEELVLSGNQKLKGYGDEGANEIHGNSGANTLWGRHGNDSLSGGKGVDHFIFAKGDDVDTITDFDATGKDHDVIDLNGFGKLKFSDVEIEKHGKDGVEISFGHGDSLILDHVKVAQLDIHDFQL